MEGWNDKIEYQEDKYNKCIKLISFISDYFWGSNENIHNFIIGIFDDEKYNDFFKENDEKFIIINYILLKNEKDSNPFEPLKLDKKSFDNFIEKEINSFKEETIEWNNSQEEKSIEKTSKELLNKNTYWLLSNHLTKAWEESETFVGNELFIDFLEKYNLTKDSKFNTDLNKKEIQEIVIEIEKKLYAFWIYKYIDIKSDRAEASVYIPFWLMSYFLIAVFLESEWYNWIVEKSIYLISWIFLLFIIYWYKVFPEEKDPKTVEEVDFYINEFENRKSTISKVIIYSKDRLSALFNIVRI